MKKLIFSLLAAAALFVSFAFGKSAKNEEIEEPEKTSNLIKTEISAKEKNFGICSFQMEARISL